MSAEIESIEVIFPTVVESASVVFPPPPAEDVSVIPIPGPPGSDAEVNAANVATVIAGVTEKTELADADQIAITDSDASGALKRLTFANLWAWIAGKISAAAFTFTQNQIFNGTLNRMPNQTAATADSAITRSIFDTRLIFTSIYLWARTYSNTISYTGNFVGSGTVINEDDTMSLRSGVTAGSSAALRSGNSANRAWHKANGATRAVPNWSLRTVHKFRFLHFGTDGADTVLRCLLGRFHATITVGDWLGTDKGIGFKVVNNVLFAHVANGSSVTTVSSGVTLGAFLLYDIAIDSDGSGNWILWLNESQVASGTGSPVGNGITNGDALQISITNGSTAAQRYINIIDQQTFQF